MVTIGGFSLKKYSKNRQAESALGFSGRSEIIRAGIRNLLAEEQERQDLSMHACSTANDL
jgi:metal-responsive CopG/Arc/MetJ family transcriptional regulator